MPVHNSAVHLAETLESFRQNSWPSVELLIIDDGSTDESVEILQKSGIPYRLWQSSQSGPAAARNSALEHAQGRYVTFLDSDDLWTDGALRKLWETLQDQSTARVAQGRIKVFADGDISPDQTFRLKPDPYYAVNLGASLFYLEDILKVEGFDPSLRFGEDTDLWMRLWEKGVAKTLIPETTLLYRLHQTNMTREAHVNSRGLLPVIKRYRDRHRGTTAPPVQGLAEYLGWNV